jgi:RNA polymerase sigma-70 factor (ECF subfamily)
VRALAASARLFAIQARREPEERLEPRPAVVAPRESGVRLDWLDARSSDEVLVAAACEGSHRAAALIVKRYSPRVRSALGHRIGRQDVDDHVQEVFVRLFQLLPRLREPRALRGFIAGITLRMACSELRRRHRSRTSLTATGEVPEPCSRADGRADDCAPAREALWRFEAILERLAPSSRRVFVLRHVEKLELTDVAARMQISLATAKRHLARAAVTVSAMAKREPALAEYVRLASAGDGPMFHRSA